MAMFAYWDRPDLSPIAGFVAEWRRHFPEFRVVGDSEVEAMIAEEFPDHLALYRSIRIPACKSDVARLMVLYRQGGLYVDSHCSLRSPEGVRALLAEAERWEVSLFDKSREKLPRPPASVKPISGILVAQSRSSIIKAAASLALSNLEEHWRAEQRSDGLVAYNIWEITGPYVLERILCRPGPHKWEPSPGLRPEYVDRVRLIEDGPEAPIACWRHHSYNTARVHWSQRQKTERLFG